MVSGGQMDTVLFVTVCADSVVDLWPAVGGNYDDRICRFWYSSKILVSL